MSDDKSVKVSVKQQQILDIRAGKKTSTEIGIKGRLLQRVTNTANKDQARRDRNYIHVHMTPLDVLLISCFQPMRGLSSGAIWYFLCYKTESTRKPYYQHATPHAPWYRMLHLMLPVTACTHRQPTRCSPSIWVETFSFSNLNWLCRNKIRPRTRDYSVSPR